MKRLSVVIPCERNNEFIHSSIQSALSAQEVLLILDGPNDDLKNILIHYVKHYNNVRLLINDYTEGWGTCINRALISTDAEYMAVQRDCDISADDRFELQCQHLDDHIDVGLVGCHITKLDASGHRIGNVSYPPATSSDLYACVLQAKQEPVLEQTVVFRRSLVEEMGGLNTTHLLCTFDLVCRMLSIGINVENIQKSLVSAKLPVLTKTERKDREYDIESIIAQFITRSYKKLTLDKRQFWQDCFSEYTYNIARE